MEAALRFRSSITVLTVAAAGSALAFSGGADAAPPGVDSAMGGGQILVSGQNAGSTIAFTAKGVGDDAKGQVQFVDRSAGTGQAQVVRHGTVDCIEVDGEIATIAGTWRDGTFFDLYVMDGGDGAGSDMIAVETDDNNECDYEPNPMNPQEVALARGNAQVNDGA